MEEGHTTSTGKHILTLGLTQIKTFLFSLSLRSQPPLFIQMVDEYVKATNDFSFVRDNMEYLMTEFNYWLQHHMVTVVVKGEGSHERSPRKLRLARFNCEDAGPRPESYFEDYEVTDTNSTLRKKK